MASLVTYLFVVLLWMLALLIGLANSQALFTPVLPPSYPLAVRNPYLSGKTSVQECSCIN